MHPFQEEIDRAFEQEAIFWSSGYWLWLLWKQSFQIGRAGMRTCGEQLYSLDEHRR